MDENLKRNQPGFLRVLRALRGCESGLRDHLAMLEQRPVCDIEDRIFFDYLARVFQKAAEELAEKGTL